MDIKFFIKKYKIVLFLFFLVVILIVLRLKYGENKEQIEEENSTKETIIESYNETYPEEMMEIEDF